MLQASPISLPFSNLPGHVPHALHGPSLTGPAMWLKFLSCNQCTVLTVAVPLPARGPRPPCCFSLEVPKPLPSLSSPASPSPCGVVSGYFFSKGTGKTATARLGSLLGGRSQPGSKRPPTHGRDLAVPQIPADTECGRGSHPLGSVGHSGPR